MDINRLVKLKRLVKRFLKKNTFIKTINVFLYLSSNCPISKKSKNSRMGKGKGKFLRHVLRFNQNHKLATFCGFPKKRLLHFFSRLSKRGFPFVSPLF